MAEGCSGTDDLPVANHALGDSGASLDAADASWSGAVAIEDGDAGGAARFDGDQARIDLGACPVSSRGSFTLRCRLGALKLLRHHYLRVCLLLELLLQQAESGFSLDVT